MQNGIVSLCSISLIDYNLGMKFVVHESKITFPIVVAVIAILAALITATARADQKDPIPHKLPETAKTYEEIETLPVRLVKMHLVSVSEGQCTIDLAEQLETENAFSWEVSDYVRLYAVPCAKWADNQSWKIYAEFNEPQKDNHGMFRRMTFATLDWQGRIQASDIVHIWNWNDEKKTIESAFLYNGRLDCGSLYEYIWDEPTQIFKMNRVRMKSVCDGDMGEWPEIPLPGTPALVK